MQIARNSLLAVALFLALSCTNSSSRSTSATPSAQPGGVPPTHRAPRLQASLNPGEQVFVGQRIAFSIRVSDTDADRVSLRCENPPAGLTFDPVTARQTPYVAYGSWLVNERSGGVQRVFFSAREESQAGATARLTLRVQVGAYNARNRLYAVGDVTGDGIDDVVAGSTRASVTASEQGAIYVWSGSAQPQSGPPVARLLHPNAASGDELGDSGGQGLQLEDLNGDGVLDIVASSRTTQTGGTIFVWSGGAGLTGEPTPSWSLQAPSGSSVSGSSNFGLFLMLEDLTGDGLADVIVSDTRARVDGRDDAGAIFVWSSETAFQTSGAVPPDATLVDLEGSEHVYLGTLLEQHFQLHDVSGDGQRDLISLSSEANTAAETPATILVWEGRSNSHRSGTTRRYFEHLGGLEERPQRTALVGPQWRWDTGHRVFDGQRRRRSLSRLSLGLVGRPLSRNAASPRPRRPRSAGRHPGVRRGRVRTPARRPHRGWLRRLDRGEFACQLEARRHPCLGRRTRFRPDAGTSSPACESPTPPKATGSAC